MVLSRYRAPQANLDDPTGKINSYAYHLALLTSSMCLIYSPQNVGQALLFLGIILLEIPSNYALQWFGPQVSHFCYRQFNQYSPDFTRFVCSSGSASR